MDYAKNTNIKAMNYLNLMKWNINWSCLSANPSAILLLTNNQNKINWIKLHYNINPKAIKLLEKNPNMINWTILSYNKNAIELLKSNQNNINWFSIGLNPKVIEIIESNNKKYLISNIIYKNPNIFVYDYKQMEINFMNMNEEIMMEVLKPERVFRNLKLFNYNFNDMYE